MKKKRRPPETWANQYENYHNVRLRKHVYHYLKSHHVEEKETISACIERLLGLVCSHAPVGVEEKEVQNANESGLYTPF